MAQRVPLLLTTKQAAEALQTSPQLIRRLIKQRRLRPYRLGDRCSEFRIPIASLMAFLERDERWLAKLPPPMRRRIDETEKRELERRALRARRRNVRKPDDDGGE